MRSVPGVTLRAELDSGLGPVCIKTNSDCTPNRLCQDPDLWPATCAGDTDYDGFVDVNDIVNVVELWGV